MLARVIVTVWTVEKRQPSKDVLKPKMKRQGNRRVHSRIHPWLDGIKFYPCLAVFFFCSVICIGLSYYIRFIVDIIWQWHNSFTELTVMT